MAQSNNYDKTLPTLSKAYQIISNLMTAFGLILEHSKPEIFHFSRQQNDMNPSLDLSQTNGPILIPKPTWRYLGFYFNRRLTFKEYIRHYLTKVGTARDMGWDLLVIF